MVTRSLRDICQMVKDLSKDCKSCSAVNRKIPGIDLASIQRLAWGQISAILKVDDYPFLAHLYPSTPSKFMNTLLVLA